MGTIGRIAIFMLAMLVAASIGWSAPATAQSSTSYRAELNQLTLDMRAMWGELERFEVKRRYCLPPDEPSKAEDQAALDALEARVDEVNARYRRTKQGLEDFLKNNTKIAGGLMNNGVDPSDHRWWTRYETSRKMMNDELARKKAALAAAPEINCSPKPKAKPAVAAGPPAPPLPVRPGIAPLNWPPMPPHFCSQEEYWKFILERINPLFEQAARDAETAARFRTQVEVQVNNLVQADKPIPPALAALRRQAIADVKKYDRLSAEAADIRRRAGQIPVIDCRQPTPRQDPPRTSPPTATEPGPKFQTGSLLDTIRNRAWAQLEAMKTAYERCDAEAYERALGELRRLLDEARLARGAATGAGEFSNVTPKDADGLADSLRDMIRQREWQLIELRRKCPTRAQPPATPSQTGFIPPSDPRMRIIFDEHNKARAEVGVPRLQWDPQLAAGAAAYAAELARTGQRVHAPREGRGAVRENLNQGMLGWRPGQMVQNWLKEKQDFSPGTYPNVTRTGRWQDVSHYTQIIWPTTTHVGCGLTSGSGYQWLVCRYSPGGNKDGQAVGLPSNRPVIAQDIAPPNSSTPTIRPDLPREKMGGGMTQIDPPAPPPPPPPTARDDAPDGKEENHPLVGYGAEAFDRHAAAMLAGDAAAAEAELARMRYTLEELRKRLKAAKKAKRFSSVKPEDVQKQVDEMERKIRVAEERRPPGTSPLPAAPAPPPPPPPPPPP